jgi:uncharacterized coiled-coil DUF342 family protein
MNETKDTLIQKYRAKLEQTQARIDLLKAKADEANADTRIRIQEEIDDIRSREDSLAEKLDDLKTAGGDAWQDLKAGAEESWKSLSNAVERATSRFG